MHANYILSLNWLYTPVPYYLEVAKSCFIISVKLKPSLLLNALLCICPLAFITECTPSCSYVLLQCLLLLIIWHQLCLL